MLPTEGGEHIFKKIDKILKKGCVKHEEQKENSTWNTKFINLDVCCIQPFLSIRL